MSAPDQAMPQSPSDRSAHGRAARATSPRSGHSTFDPAVRGYDALELLERQAQTRVPELVPIRYARMASTPFAFFRGAAYVMAADLASTPTSGLTVQLCGDAHLSNFGLFASPERQLVFDINDFDETLPGPWEWDVKRLVASIEVAGRGNSFSAQQRRDSVTATVAEYRRAMREFAGWNNLAVWYAHLPVEPRLAEARGNLDPATARLARRTVSKARSRDHLQAFGSLVRTVDGLPRFVSDPPLTVPIEELLSTAELQPALDRITASVEGYRETLSADRRHLLDQYRLVHVARKVVGVGSVGTRAWVVLMQGRDESDPLILQIKEAQASVLEEFSAPSVYDNAGHRVVAGQRTMQASSDILLGWQRYAGFDETPRDFYVRQLRDWKGSVEIEQMGPGALSAYGKLCAWTLARAHARSGDRIAIAGYLGGSDVFDRALVEFAATYADQNERDHAALMSAIADGRIQSA